MCQRFALAAAAALALCAPASAQITYTWNNTGSDWNTSANWNPNGVPGFTGGTATPTDIALFNPNGSSFGTPAVNPNVDGAVPAIQSLTVGPSQNFDGWTFTGTNGPQLTIGGTGPTGLTTVGPATYTFNGPALAGAGATSLLNLSVGTGSTLALGGNSAVTANQGTVTVTSGTLRLDNSVTSVQTRLLTTSTVTLTGGGVLDFIGNAAGTTANVGLLSAGNNNVGGVNVIRVTPNGATATLNFANINTGSTGGFASRPGTRGIYQYVATSGNLGDANGARVTFVGTPYLGANGLLANSAGGGTVGFAIATDAGGTDFATYSPTAGVGIIRATPTVTATTAAQLQAGAATDRVQFNPAAGATVTATATVTNGSLRITPAGAGAVLALGTNALATNALMIDGSNDFAITGTGLLGGTGTRYIYVNNPSATLSTSIGVANGGNPTTFGGPGFVDLTGTASQNTLTTTNRFVIAGGVVRGNNTQIGFGSTGGPGIISLTGGVLEIKGGANGTGASADFTRSLGAAAGNVTWGAATSNEQGSGGFSAFGSAASVNIGGAATPAGQVWNAANFVADGFALRFGSTKSNAPLTWLNPIALDATTNTAYQLREVNVTAGVGGDRTVLAGAITGTTNADLVKTGTGTLELSAANTYAGNTLVAGGTLLVTGSVASGKPVTVAGGAAVGGTGTVAGAVNVAANGTVQGGNGATATGTLTVSNLTLADNGRVRAVLGTTDYSKINATGTFNTLTSTGTIYIDLTNAGLPDGPNNNGGAKYIVLSYGGGLGPNAPAAGTSYTSSTPGRFVLPGTSDWSISVNSNNLVLNSVTFQPVPEPGLLLVTAAGVLGLAGAIRRRRATA